MTTTESAADPQRGTILGIIAVICGVLGLLPSFGIVLAIVGLVLGLMARSQAGKVGNRTGRTLGTVGTVLSSITLVIALVMLVVLGSLVAWVSGGSGKSSLAPYYGVWICEGANTYEFRPDFVEVNGMRRVERYSVKKLADGSLSIDAIAYGLTIEPRAGGISIVGKPCDRVRN
jgi:hypothetical protein